jgi:hypothetical protein
VSSRLRTRCTTSSSRTRTTTDPARRRGKHGWIAHYVPLCTRTPSVMHAHNVHSSTSVDMGVCIGRDKDNQGSAKKTGCEWIDLCLPIHAQPYPTQAVMSATHKVCITSTFVTRCMPVCRSLAEHCCPCLSHQPKSMSLIGMCAIVMLLAADALLALPAFFPVVLRCLT